MGAAFFTPGTIEIRTELNDKFSQSKIAGTAASYQYLFDKSNGYLLSDAVVAMDLPAHNNANFGPKLQLRFVQLLKAMQASDANYGSHTSAQIQKATFDALAANLNVSPSATQGIKFYVAHQDSNGPFSADTPEYVFVQWDDSDDNGRGWFNFLLICPTLPPPIAARLKKVVAKKAKKARKAKKAKE
jgi:hypothetical protein